MDPAVDRRHPIFARVLTALAVALTCPPIHAADGQLAALYAADQQERLQPGGLASQRGAALRDARRREAVRQRMTRLAQPDAADYAHAASILLHGPDLDSLLEAYALTAAGLRSHPGDARLRRLRVLAWDRLQLQQGRPQWYGTQFETRNCLTQALHWDRSALNEAQRVADGGYSDAELAQQLEDAKRHAPPCETPAQLVGPAFRLALAPDTLERLLATDARLAHFLLTVSRDARPRPEKALLLEADAERVRALYQRVDAARTRPDAGRAESAVSIKARWEPVGAGSTGSLELARWRITIDPRTRPEASMRHAPTACHELTLREQDGQWHIQDWLACPLPPPEDY